MGTNNSKPKWTAEAQTALMVAMELFGRPQAFAEQPRGVAFWYDFDNKTLLGRNVVFNKFIIQDTATPYGVSLPIGVPAADQIAAIQNLDPRIMYNRISGNLLVCGENLGTVIAVARAAVLTLAGKPKPNAMNYTNDPVVARADYADLVANLSGIRTAPIPISEAKAKAAAAASIATTENYSSYDDGWMSNMPYALAAADRRDAQFYANIAVAGDFPYLQNETRSSPIAPGSESVVSVKEKGVRSSYSRDRPPPKASADMAINSGRNEKTVSDRSNQSARERMTDADIVNPDSTNKPWAIAYNDDRRAAIYADMPDDPFLALNNPRRPPEGNRAAFLTTLRATQENAVWPNVPTTVVSDAKKYNTAYPAAGLE